MIESMPEEDFEQIVAEPIHKCSNNPQPNIQNLNEASICEIKEIKDIDTDQEDVIELRNRVDKLEYKLEQSKMITFKDTMFFTWNVILTILLIKLIR